MKRVSPLVRIPARYGLLAAMMGLLLMVTLYYLNKHPFFIPVFYDFRIFLFGVFAFFALKEFRETHQDNVLYFWQGMIGSYVLIGVYTLVMCIGLLIFGTLEYNFVPDYITSFTEQAKTFPPEAIERIGKEEFERNLNAVQSTDIYDLAFGVYLPQSLIIGFFISIIISVILRKQPKP